MKRGFKPWTYERVLSRCVEEGACCQIWQGSTDGGGYPQARIDGELGRVARWVLEQSLGRPIKQGMVASPTCGSPRCCSMACLVERSISQSMKQSHATGKRMRPQELLRRRAAQVAKGLTLLDMDKAREIRLRADASSAELAKEFGVHRDTINAVRRNKTWREVGASVFHWRPA